jgi:hypothetical protein
MSRLGGKWFKRAQARIGSDAAPVQNLQEPRHLHALGAIERQPTEISSRSMKMMQTKEPPARVSQAASMSEHA